ncbi:MAG TPA: mandelate racemase/muconate lactonizing enzyme family protein [Burkholderiaceae bacterium]|jgi:L-alanine-DL-glutamate epimerase-like enolase superfamily enzyme
MAIRSIQTLPVRVPFDVDGPKQEFLGKPRSHVEALYLRVETDDGVVGWGEAFGFNLWPVVRKAIDEFIGPFTLGRNENDIAALMTDLRRRFHIFGRTGPVNYALSGLDIALWDIAGKKANKPLYELLGGAKRTRLRSYASLMKYGEVEALMRNCETARQRGHYAVKIHESTVALSRAAREALGPDVGLMVDTNCAWSLEQASSYLPELAALDLLWLEEPTWPPENLDQLKALRAISDVALAAGENAATPWELAAMSDAGVLDVIQPSVTKIGGLCEMQAALTALVAREHETGSAKGQPVPHCPYFGPGLLASMHVTATLERDTPVEKLFCNFEAHPYGAAIEAVDGFLAVPSGPGLGVEPDPRLLAEFAVA